MVEIRLLLRQNLAVLIHFRVIGTNLWIVVVVCVRGGGGGDAHDFLPLILVLKWLILTFGLHPLLIFVLVKPEIVNVELLHKENVTFP